ncbi:MAG TPA: NADH-quinone oxidoreductase subunit H, partial [Nitrososphaera sp.]
MASYPQNFRFGEFVGSLLWLIFWVLIIVTLVGLPLIFIVLYYVPLPPINGEVLTPFLFLTMVVDPSRTIPIIKQFMTTDLFRVAAFPGFTYAALIAAATIFVERKFLAKMQLRIGPLYAGKIEGIFQLIADGLKLIAKEIIVPSGADKPIFWAAP